VKLLDGQAAVVTGGAQGIALAIAGVFAGHGARLVLADIDERAAIAAGGTCDVPGPGGIPPGTNRIRSARNMYIISDLRYEELRAEVGES
jgi:NAD(P)-dependent dehydrogenase (short-subunit alcohol dehydrogenase family)